VKNVRVKAVLRTGLCLCEVCPPEGGTTNGLCLCEECPPEGGTTNFSMNMFYKEKIINEKLF